MDRELDVRPEHEPVVDGYGQKASAPLLLGVAAACIGICGLGWVIGLIAAGVR